MFTQPAANEFDRITLTANTPGPQGEGTAVAVSQTTATIINMVALPIDSYRVITPPCAAQTLRVHWLPTAIRPFRANCSTHSRQGWA